MKLTNQQKWFRTLKFLRREFPLAYPVRVRTRCIKDCGDTTFIDGRGAVGGLFSIRVNGRKPFDSRIDTILHEWAHAMTWFGADANIEDHGPEWGVAYAKVYKAHTGWDYGRNEKWKSPGFNE